MEKAATLWNATDLAQKEEEFREHLEQNPSDHSARMRLAWCLFLRAFEETVRTTLWQEALEINLESIVALQTHAAAALRHSGDSGVSALLKESLALASAATQMSLEYRREATVLKDMVQLLGGERIVRESDEEISAMLNTLARDIYYERRRRARRRRA